jgi:hypothetical protein
VCVVTCPRLSDHDLRELERRGSKLERIQFIILIYRVCLTALPLHEISAFCRLVDSHDSPSFGVSCRVEVWPSERTVFSWFLTSGGNVIGRVSYPPEVSLLSPCLCENSQGRYQGYPEWSTTDFIVRPNAQIQREGPAQTDVGWVWQLASVEAGKPAAMKPRDKAHAMVGKQLRRRPAYFSHGSRVTAYREVNRYVPGACPAFPGTAP